MLFPIALSPSGLALALGVRREKVLEAIRDGELIAYDHGKARRVLVVDAVEWVRKHWSKSDASH